MSNEIVDALFAWKQMWDAASRLKALLEKSSRPTPKQAREAVQYLMDDWVIARLAEALLASLAAPQKDKDGWNGGWREPLEKCLNLMQANRAAKAKLIPAEALRAQRLGDP